MTPLGTLQRSYGFNSVFSLRVQIERVVHECDSTFPVVPCDLPNRARSSIESATAECAQPDALLLPAYLQIGSPNEDLYLMQDQRLERA